jgi:hypothetical protein
LSAVSAAASATARSSDCAKYGTAALTASVCSRSSYAAGTDCYAKTTSSNFQVSSPESTRTTSAAAVVAATTTTGNY